MKLNNIIRHNGNDNLSLVECCNNKLQKYRVRTDFQVYINPITEEESGVTFIEIEFPYKPSIKEVKEFVLGIINLQTDEKILSEFIWNNKPVYLSTENQFNFKAAYDLAVQTNGQNLPITFKLGEINDEPIYHTFTTVEELADFYMKATAYINQCLNEGWQKKDNIDWSIYEEALNNNNE